MRQDLAVQELDRILSLDQRGIGQPGIVPAEVPDLARVGCRHHVAAVRCQIEEGILKDPVGMAAGGELRHRVMHVLILLVLDLQRDDGQAVEEEDEVDFLVGLAEVEVRTEGDAVLAVLVRATLSLERGLG